LREISPSAVGAQQPERPKLLQILGPGLITGASDDDPSGIATYSQAGAQFGYALGWTLLFTWPLMSAIQEISARIGRVSGQGLAGVIKRHYSPAILYTLVSLLVVANTINIGADLGAMAASLGLLIGGPQFLYVGLFGVLSVLLEVFLRYSRYVSVLKWLTLSLFAYVCVAFVVDVPWAEVARSLIVPKISFDSAYLTVVVAVLGTTISPYLFFWQAGQEVEEVKERDGAKPLLRAPEQAEPEFERIRIDTISVWPCRTAWRFSSSSPPPRRCMRMASPISRPHPRRPRRSALSRRLSRSWSSRSASLARACSRSRSLRARQPTPWARPLVGTLGSRAGSGGQSNSMGPSQQQPRSVSP
jgi:hypothetical protein